MADSKDTKKPAANPMAEEAVPQHKKLAAGLNPDVGAGKKK